MCLYPVSIATFTDSYAVPLGVVRGSPYVPSPIKGMLFPSFIGTEWLSAVKSILIKVWGVKVKKFPSTAVSHQIQADPQSFSFSALRQRQDSTQKGEAPSHTNGQIRIVYKFSLVQWWKVTKYIYSSTVQFLGTFHLMLLYTYSSLHFRGKCYTFYSTTFIWHL